MVVTLVWLSQNQPQAQATATQPPTPPSYFNSNAFNAPNLISLGWGPINYNDGVDFAHLKIERSAGSPGNWQTILDLSGAYVTNISNHNDYSLDRNVTYYYRLTANNSFGAAVPLITSSTSTGSEPAPTNLTATVLSGNAIKLHYTDNSSLQNDPNYIEFSESTVGPWITRYATQYDYASSTFTNTGFVPGKTYYFRALSDDHYAPSVASNVVSVTTTSPAAIPNSPSNPLVNSVSDQALNLRWQDNSNDETGFLIERSNSAAGPWTKLAFVHQPDTVVYQDQYLMPGTTYYYQVSAFNSFGRSAPSSVVSGITQTSTRVPDRADQPLVSGKYIQGLVYPNTTGYRIERSVGGNIWQTTANFYVEDGPNAGIYNYFEPNTPINTYFSYRVVAFNSVGDAVPSPTASAFFQSSYLPVGPSNLTLNRLSDSSVALNWTDNSTSEFGYEIYRSQFTAYGPWDRVVSIDGPDVTSYVDNSLTPGRTYYYKVNATRGYYHSNPATASINMVFNIPSTPEALAAYSLSDTTINLNWTKTGFAGVRLERSSDGISGWANVTTISDPNVTSYVDTALTLNTIYYYRLIAYNELGDSAPSKVAQATAGVSTRVIVNTDRGDVLDQDAAGTLSYFLKHTQPGQTVTFSPTISSVTVSGALRPVPAGVTVLGDCSSSTSLVTIKPATGFSGPLLLNKGNVTLWGLKIMGFKNVQISAVGGTGNNHFICTKIS